MLLEKQSDLELLNITKKYFKLGLFFLPMLWAVMFVWIYPHALKRESNETISRVKNYCRIGIFGSAIFFLLFASWLGIYLQNRDIWSFGDAISVVIPKGY
jgi:hypothetical protein